MKNYYLNYLISFLIGLFLFLFLSDRLIIIPFKHIFKKEDEDSLLIENKNIKLFSNFNNKNTIFNLNLKFDIDSSSDYENLLIKYFSYIYQESNGELIVKLNNCALGRNLLIIDFNINLKNNLKFTINDEYNFHINIFKTIKSINPSIKRIYFYKDGKPFFFKYLGCFIDNEIFEDLKIKKNLNEIKENIKIKIVPILNKNGNLINGIYEKNIFQKLILKDFDINFLNNQDLFSFDYINEINKLDCDFILGISFSDKNNFFNIYRNVSFEKFSIDNLYSEISDEDFYIKDLNNKEILLFNNILNFCSNNNLNFNIKNICNFNLSRINKPFFILEIGLKKEDSFLILENFIKTILI